MSPTSRKKSSYPSERSRHSRGSKDPRARTEPNTVDFNPSTSYPTLDRSEAFPNPSYVLSSGASEYQTLQDNDTATWTHRANDRDPAGMGYNVPQDHASESSLLSYSMPIDEQFPICDVEPWGSSELYRQSLMPIPGDYALSTSRADNPMEYLEPPYEADSLPRPDMYFYGDDMAFLDHGRPYRNHVDHGGPMLVDPTVPRSAARTQIQSRNRTNEMYPMQQLPPTPPDSDRSSCSDSPIQMPADCLHQSYSDTNAGQVFRPSRMAQLESLSAGPYSGGHTTPVYRDGNDALHKPSGSQRFPPLRSASERKQSLDSQEATSVRSSSKDSLDANQARNHVLYKGKKAKDGHYHCPFSKETQCAHSPTQQKCTYDKYLDSHLKPYQCRNTDCKESRFSSNACLFRHEREAHGMHGHGENPHGCWFPNCDRAQPGNGFPRRWNLGDHMKRVHDFDMTQMDSSPTRSSSISTSAQVQSSRKRRTSGSAESARMKRHGSSQARAELVHPPTARRDATRTVPETQAYYNTMIEINPVDGRDYNDAQMFMGDLHMLDPVPYHPQTSYFPRRYASDDQRVLRVH